MTASARSRAGGGVHVALLRGVNLGGKNIVPMKELAALFTKAGCEDVRTYIQSGNVVFSADAALARRVPALIAQALAARFRITIPVVTRTAAELADVATHNPFLTSGVDPQGLHVGFLLARPGKAQIAALDPHRSSPDRFAVHGREVYLHFPNGVARSKLTAAYFDAMLGTTITLRNWNTVLQLAELSGT